MATLSELVKKRRQSGQGVFQSLGTSLKEKIKESIDPRQILDQSGLLVSLFPQLKAYRADVKRESGLSIQRKTSEIVNRSVELSDNSLDVIEKNTQITAKNLLILPAMARDVNVLRQNFTKLLKAFNITPTNKADAFFKKSSEREAEYESKFKKKDEKNVSPESLSVTDQEKSKGFMSFLGDLFGGIIKTFLGVSKVIFTLLSNVVVGLVGGLVGKMFKIFNNFLKFKVLGLLLNLIPFVRGLKLLKWVLTAGGVTLSAMGLENILSDNTTKSSSVAPKNDPGDSIKNSGPWMPESTSGPFGIDLHQIAPEWFKPLPESSPSKVNDETGQSVSMPGPVGGLVTPAITPEEQLIADDYNNARIKQNLDPLPMDHPEIQDFIRKYKSPTSADVPKDDIRVESVQTSMNSNRVADQLNQYFNEIKVAKNITPSEDTTTVIPNQQSESESFQDTATRMASVINEDILPYFSGGMNVNAV